MDASTEFFDPASDTFSAGPNMLESRALHSSSALANGRVLIAGGFDVTIDLTTQTFQLGAIASADRFAQGPNALAPTGSMAAPRLFPLAVNLPDGTVMVVGGGPLDAEVYQR